MVRIVFLVLLLVNLAVLAWAAGYLGVVDGEGREPERLVGQIQPERLKVEKEVKGELPNMVCRRTGPLGVSEAEAIEKLLVAAGGVVERVAVDEPASFWVYVAPIEGKAAENEIAALKKAGFKEFFVVTEEGAYRNAISLGSFRTEEGARDKIAILARNGIKTAKMLARPASTGKIQLNIRATAEILDKGLAGSAAEAVDCPKQ